MLADKVTKPLGSATFDIFEDQLMNVIMDGEFKSKVILLKGKKEEPKVEKVVLTTLEAKKIVIYTTNSTF